MPICLGIIPVGISFGLMARQVGLEVWQTVAMSIFVFAGASQIMAVGMLAQGAAAPMIVLATFLLNLRHLVMSSYVMNRLKSTKPARRLLLAYALCDESFALFSMSPHGEREDSFLLGINAVLYTSWALSTLAGAAAMAALPEIVSDSLGIAFYAAFLSILMPKIRGNMRLFAVVLVTVLINVALGAFMSPSAAVVLSMLLGAGAGMFIIRDETEARS